MVYVTPLSGAPAQQNAQTYTYFVEARPSMCEWGSYNYLANSQAEVDPWPSDSYAVEPISVVQTFDLAADCGQSCTGWTVRALSSNDAKSCVQNQNQNDALGHGRPLKKGLIRVATGAANRLIVRRPPALSTAAACGAISDEFVRA